MRPDVVLITGDLTENGLISEFNTASKELKRLQSKKIIYISGNHELPLHRLFAFQTVFSVLIGHRNRRCGHK